MNNLLHKIGRSDLSEQLLEELRTAINNLPVENRQAIKLHFLQNISRKEIANQLNWSASKVHNRITRGISLLKAELNPTYFQQMRELANSFMTSPANVKERR